MLGMRRFCQIGHNKLKSKWHFFRTCKRHQLGTPRQCPRPVLFLIYINDLSDMIIGADNAKIYRSISAIEHIHQFQFIVNQSEMWVEIWEMFLNLKKKCKHLHIGARYQSATYTMKSGQEQLEIEKI